MSEEIITSTTTTTTATTNIKRKEANHDNDNNNDSQIAGKNNNSSDKKQKLPRDDTNNNDHNNATTTATDVECHIVPCNIDYHGGNLGSSLQSYFVQEKLISVDKDGNTNTTGSNSSNSSNNHNNDEDEKCTSGTQIYASQLRGRGLLGIPIKQQHRQPNSNIIHGKLLVMNNKNKNNLDISMNMDHNNEQQPVMVRVQHKFNTIYDWYHEYQVEEVINTANTNSGGNLNRIQTAIDWCQISNTLHQPLPVSTKSSS